MWIQKTSGGVKQLAYAPDGRTLYVIDSGGWVTAWDISTRARTRLFQLDAVDRFDPSKPFMVAGRFLVLSGFRGIHVWDVVAGAALPTRPGPYCFQYPCPARSGPAVLFIGDGRKSLDAHDVVTGLRTPGLPAPAGVGNVTQFSAAADGSIVLLDDKHRAALVCADGSVIPIRIPAIKNDLKDVRFSPDGTALVWLLRRGVKIWEAPSLAVRVGFARCSSEKVFAFSPTAPVFTALDGDGALTLFSLHTGRPIRALDFQLGNTVQCAEFAPDGLTCTVGGSNKQFAVFDVDV